VALNQHWDLRGKEDLKAHKGSERVRYRGNFDNQKQLE